MEQVMASEAGRFLQNASNSDNFDEFQGLNQQRMQLMGLRVQRKKIELLAEELVTLESMYVSKVEENIELKTENRRLNSLLEIIQKEKEDYLQELELLREKHSNAIIEMDRMYSDNEQMQRLIEASGQCGTSQLRQLSPDRRQIEQKVSSRLTQMKKLQHEVAELSNQLEGRKMSGNAGDARKLTTQIASLEKQVRDEKTAHRKAEEELIELREEIEKARAEIDRLRAQTAEKDRLVDELRTRQAAVRKQYQQSAEELRRGPLPDQSSNSRKDYIERTKNNLTMMKQIQMQKIDEVVEAHSLRASKPNRY